MPSYSRQTLETPNPIARYAHRKRYGTSLEVADAVCHSAGTVLDYGCGEGTYLEMLARRRPDIRLLGYDPFSDHIGLSYTKVDSLAAVDRRSVDVLTCFETMEHLDESETCQLLHEVNRLLKPGGRLVISVPIIGGPTLILKEGNRMLLHRRRSDYHLREFLAAAILGRPAERTTDIKASHKGWDFRNLVGRLAGASFTSEREILAPFHGLPWWLNSQVVYVFR